MGLTAKLSTRRKEEKIIRKLIRCAKSEVMIAVNEVVKLFEFVS